MTVPIWPTLIRADGTEASYDASTETLTVPLDHSTGEAALVALMRADATAVARLARSHPDTLASRPGSDTARQSLRTPVRLVTQSCQEWKA